METKPERSAATTQTIVIGNLVSAQDADFTCDGVDDHVQFQQAMDALPSVKLHLVVLQLKKSQHIEGGDK